MPGLAVQGVALNVTEPSSTGIGGDAFALYFKVQSGCRAGGPMVTQLRSRMPKSCPMPRIWTNMHMHAS